MRILIISLFAASMVSAAERPNVVFFLVDDLGYSDVACYGNPLYETPHVDQLAKEGVRFTDASAASAVCSPSSSIRVGDYKFIRHYEDGKRELYSLREDIGETHNLVSVMPEKAAELEAKLDEWLTAGGAYIPESNPDFVPPQPKTEQTEQ